MLKKTFFRAMLTALLAFTIAISPVAQAQQQQPQNQNWRILVPLDEKPKQQNNQTGPRTQKPQLVLQTGVSEPASKLAFSPDGSLLAVMGSSAGSIKLWEVASGRELLALKPREGATRFNQAGADFIFSADGRSLTSIAAGTLRQWETITGRLIRELSLFEGREFGQAQFSPDGRLLATLGGESNQLRVWDAATGAMLQSQKYGVEREKFKASIHTVNAFAFSPDSRLLAVGEEIQEGISPESKIVVRDVASWKTAQTITLKPAISEKDQMKAMKKASRDQMDALMTGKAGPSSALAGMESTQTTPSRAIKFTPDGRSLVLLKRDYSMTFSMTASSLSEKIKYSQSVAIKFYDAASGRESSTVNVSDAREKKMLDNSFFSSGNTIALSADGGRCLVIGNDSTVKLLDVSGGRSVATISSDGAEMQAVTFSADGKRAATGAFDGSARIWDIGAAASTGRTEIVRTLSSSAMGVGDVVFNQDGRSMVVSSYDSVSLWELSTGTAMKTLSLNKPRPQSFDDYAGQIFVASLSVDGKYFFSGAKGALKVYDTRNGAEVRSIAIPTQSLRSSLAINSDGARLAFASELDARSILGNPSDSSASEPSQPAQTIPGLPAGATVMTQGDQDDKKDKKDKKGGGFGLGNLGGFGRIGGSGGSKAQKVDTKEVMRLNKEVQKKQEEYNKAMQNGDTAKAGQIMQEISALTAQMMEASGTSQSQMPFPAPGSAQSQQSDQQTQSSSPRVSSLGDMMRSDGVKVLDGTGGEVMTVKGRDLADLTAQAIALSPNGGTLATAFNGYTIRLSEVPTGKDLANLKIDRGFINEGIVFSPDGRFLASLISETRPGVNQNQMNLSLSQRYLNTLRVWDISNPAAARELQAITVAEQYPNISFSPDGRLISVASSEVKFYEVASGRESLKLSGHTLPVGSVRFSPDGKQIVTGSEDGSARMWNAQTGELLATMVQLNGGADWLVVTPDGLFDGTPGAWNQILWRFSQNIFDVTPVEVYFNEFFYPGLLADIYAGKRPRAAQDVAQKDRRQPVVTLSPADGQTTNIAGRNIKVKIEVSEPDASANNSAGARDVRLFRNGTLIKVWRGDVLKGQRRVALETTLPIVAGENRLTAYAFNRDNVKSSDAISTITGAESLRRKGVVYVIACGVNQYANAQYNLKYAVADATSFADEVRAQQAKLQQYERVEIIPLLDKDATKENFLLALKRLSGADLSTSPPAVLAKIQPAQPEDAVMIYFAGHGTAQGARFYLVPHDLGYTGARNALTPQAVQTILSRSISDLELEAAIESLDASQLLFVLDACNSGQALEAEEKRRGPMNSSGLAQLAYEKGMYILTAAQSYQVALEASQLGHGYLTFALVDEGLKKGLADRDLKDGQVLAREWFNYATERVPQMQEKNLGSRILLEEEKAKDPATGRSVQRPRVFYRRELEARPFVVAKP